MEETTENTAPETDHDVDALMAQIEAGEETNAQPTEAPTEAIPKAEDAFEFEINGEKISDRNKILDLAKSGYEYQTASQKLEADRQAFAEQEKGLGPYREIDQFAQKNPQWWDYVQKSYQGAQQAASATPEIPDNLKSYLEPIISDYKDVKQFVTNYQREQVEKQVREQDAQYKQTVAAVASKWGIDFANKDASGKTLEQRVLDYAQATKQENFESAYKLYDFDNIAKRLEAKGREAIATEQKKQKESGILRGNPVPNFDFNPEPPQERGRSSWSDAYSGALDDLRQLQRA